MLFPKTQNLRSYDDFRVRKISKSGKFPENAENCVTYAILPFLRHPGGAGRLRNLDNPIGIRRFSPWAGQQAFRT